MEYKDYYQIMGVERTATQDEIKRAYRKLARKYHPDVSKEADAEKRFKEVGEAYEVLKDAEKRVAYDQLGENWKAGQDFNAPPDWDAGFEFGGSGFGGGDNTHYQQYSSSGGSSYSDFFESLFGQGFAGGRTEGGFQSAGRDHHAKILINLEDSMQGATRSISLQVPDVDAAGHVTTKERVLKVNIPKGIKQGQHIRLSGQGNPGMGNAKAGDLYLEVEFNPHSIYRVDGRDVYLDLPLAPWELILGASVKVPTPGGAVELKIKPGSVNASKMRLKGRGIPASSKSNSAGDLYVVLQVVLPPANNDSEKEAYEKMQKSFSFNPRAKLGV